jgi:glycosyltransferase involved in cell wall biosynthesis
MGQKIAFVGNSLQTMCNFRMGVMSELVREGYEVVVIAPKDGDVTALKQAQIRLIPIEMDCKGMNPFVDMRLAKTLRNIYRKEQFSVVFHFTIKPVIYGSWAARRAKIPQISVITGLGYTFIRKGWINRLAKMLYRYALRTANEVWFLNQEDKSLFVEQSLVSPFKARLINGEGVDVNKYQSHADLTTTPFTFLFVGRVLWDKGVGEFVKAAQVIKKQHPRVQFHILGQLGANNPACVSIEQMEIWEQTRTVKYLGETSNVLPYIERATCLVLPSYREGVSRVLMEAASMERPIIATNVPGCREMVIDGHNGFLCEAQDTNSLIACMMHMLSLSEIELKAFGKNGRTHVLRYFDEQLTIALYKHKLQEFFLTDEQ